MKNNLVLNKNELNIFHEGRKRRVFVAKLIHNVEESLYELIYNESYVYSDTAIPLGAELDLFNLHHRSEKGKMFPSFIDRIPSRENPAYEDYCAQQGIESDEENLIVLLGTIGKRGPSSFIFELIYESNFTINMIKQRREKIGVTQHDLATALNISLVTLARLETGKSNDLSTLRKIEVFFTFPEVAMWQLKQTRGWLHSDALRKFIQFFKRELQQTDA